MRNNVLNVVFFLAIATGLTFLFIYADKHWIPKPEKKAKKADEEAEVQKKAEEEAAKRLTESEAKKTAAGAAAGFPAVVVDPPVKPAPKPPEPPKAPAEPPKPVRLIALGDSTFYNQVLLSTHGGGVQQVVLPKFEAADRLGRPVKGVPMYLIPGIPQPRGRYLNEPFIVPELAPGVVADPAALTEPAYTVFHYRHPDDKNPDPFLGETDWKVVAEEHPEGGVHKVVFEAELGAPHFVKFRKTYTLGPKDYHVGLRVEIERLAGGKKDE